MEVLKAAYDRGVTTFDTANMYSNGESERLIGKFIQKVCKIDIQAFCSINSHLVAVQHSSS